MRLIVSSPCEGDHLAHNPGEQLKFALDQAAWDDAQTFAGKSHGDRKNKEFHLYETRVIRFALPCDRDKPRGDVKVVWRRCLTRESRGEVLLMMWSPPHIHRGIPIPEFLHFLDKAIEQTDQKKIRMKAGPLRQLTTAFHNVISNSKTDTGFGANRSYLFRDAERPINLYDVNQYFIQDEVTNFDASYAEIRTVYGPAELFVSHVWGETVQNTKRSLAKFLEASPGMSETTRLWFCICCNNQARVIQELGGDVQYSPFALVLRSETCSKVIMISPLKALERKWCNYEFSLAVLEGKEPLIVTRDGVLQAGQVPPKYLNDLTEKMMSFSCCDSECAAALDEELINQAIETAGGYRALDMRLRKIFRKAIIHAHSHTKEALDRVLLEDREDPSMPDAPTVSCEDSPPSVVSFSGTASLPRPWRVVVFDGEFCVEV